MKTIKSKPRYPASAAEVIERCMRATAYRGLQAIGTLRQWVGIDRKTFDSTLLILREEGVVYLSVDDNPSAKDGDDLVWDDNGTAYSGIAISSTSTG